MKKNLFLLILSICLRCFSFCLWFYWRLVNQLKASLYVAFPLSVKDRTVVFLQNCAFETGKMYLRWLLTRDYEENMLFFSFKCHFARVLFCVVTRLIDTVIKSFFSTFIVTNSCFFSRKTPPFLCHRYFYTQPCLELVSSSPPTSAKYVHIKKNVWVTMTHFALFT